MKFEIMRPRGGGDDVLIVFSGTFSVGRNYGPTAVKASIPCATKLHSDQWLLINFQRITNQSREAF